MKYFPIADKLQVLDTEKTEGFKLSETDYSELVHLRIKPGGSIPQHALPMFVTFYVLSGSGLAINEDKTQQMNKGDVLSVEPNTQRSWENNSNEELEVLVLKQTVQ